MTPLPPGKVMVMCAPNGARKTKADHPALPITPHELAATAAAVRDAGAGVLHLHVRDADGGHTLDADAYRAAIDAVRDRVGDTLILQITTEAVGRFTPAEQMAAVRALWPEAASCAVRELAPDAAAEPAYAAFLADCADHGVWVQHILYDDADAARLMDLVARGLVPPEPSVLLVFGRTAEPAGPFAQRLPARLSALGEAAPFWSVCAFGRDETRTLVAAAALGGHVRVGFENSLVNAGDAVAPDNAARVAEVVAALQPLGLAPATAAEVRAAVSPPRR